MRRDSYHQSDLVHKDGRSQTWWSNVLLSVAAGFFTLGVATAWNRSVLGGHSNPCLVLDEVQDVGQIGVRQKRTHLVIVENRSDYPATVLGSSDLCGSSVCICTSGLPSTIPAHGAESIHIEVESGSQPGSFSEQVSLYTDCPDQAIVRVQLIGDVR